MSRNLFRTALLAASIPLLGGCVAALVPVVASTALIGKEQFDGGDDELGEVAVAEESVAEPAIAKVEPASAPVPVTPEPVTKAPIAEVQMAEIPVEELPRSDIAIPAEELAVVERPSPDFVGPIDVEQDDTAPTRIALADPPPSAVAKSASAELAGSATTELPEVATQTPPVTQPASVAIAEPARRPVLPPGPTDFRAYDALYSYVDSQARRDPVQSPRQSAVLAAPGTLSPQRTDCSIRPPAVLIDLDPGDQTFNADIAPRANPALGQILNSLRLQEVEIFWISQQPAIAAGNIRKALVASGLDAQGRDSLLLMRRSDDRKQARRKELSETHCLLAIGGDTRADFDELYLYLKDDTAAQSLEELIGAGWFLTPLPLTEGS